MCTTQACRLSGKEDFMKPVREFNVRTPSDFLTRLLPQGAWARCSSCAITRHRTRGAQLLSQKGARGDNATTDMRRKIANAAMQQCVGCKATKFKSAFWKEDWRNRDRGIKCAECEPLAPGERPRSLPPQFLQNIQPKTSEVTCKQCGVAKPRDQFWLRDLHNQRRGISCKACLPTAPEERPRGRPPSSASSGRTA